MTGIPGSRLRRLFTQAGIAAGILLAMEIILRIYGYTPRWSPLYHTFQSTRLYLPAITGSIPGFRTNPAYQQEFQDVEFTAEKGTAFRIMTTGGSAVHGWRLPDRASQNFLARLTVMLRKRHPGINFEGINAGGCAWGSYREQILTGELLRHKPDLLIVMTGNNEVLEYPLYRNLTTQPISRVRLGILMEHSRLFLFSYNIAANFLWKDPYQPPIDGHYELLGDSAMNDLLGRIESNIRSIITQCRKAGVPVIFGTTPANLKVDPDTPTDWLVGSSHHSSSLSRENLAKWNSAWNQGLERRKKGDLKGALASFLLAKSIDPAFARQYHEIGICLEKLGRYAEAREAYWTHIDRTRRLVTREINRVTARVCRELGVPLADCAASLEKASPHGLTDYSLFIDSMHPNIRGHELLAESFFGAVNKQVQLSGRFNTAR